MGSYGFRISVNPSMRTFHQGSVKATESLKKSQRENLKSQGARFVDLAGQEARGGPGGAIARGIFYRTYMRGDAAELRVYPGQIGSYHLRGTGIYGPSGQPIYPVSASVLAWEGSQGMIYAAWVRGVRPDKFFGRAYRRWLPGARSTLREQAQQWFRELRQAQGSIKSVGV